MKIPYINLSKQYQHEGKKLLSVINKVLKSGQFVGGDEIIKFEKNITKLLKVKYCVALNSGTDALTLGLYALGVRKNDEVITTANSFIASTAVIVHLGAKPVFVDVKPDQLIDPSLIEKSITKKTKAIMVVHLTGRVCDMSKINEISQKYNIPIIEDAAQSIGSKYINKYAGSFGRIGCFLAGDGDYGIPSSLPWAMSFPHGIVPTLDRVHPTPIYEFLGALAITIFLWRRGAPSNEKQLSAGEIFSLWRKRVMAPVVDRLVVHRI